MVLTRRRAPRVAPATPFDAASTQVYKQTIEDAICELHDKVRANQIQIIDGTYSTRALRLLLSK